MSLLEYFKRKEPFPDPTGPLARVLPASAIMGANREVERSVCSKSRKGQKKKVYSPRKKAQMGKLACSIGATAAAKSFSRKLGVKINESTVRGFKRAYLAERSAKRLRKEEDCSVNEIQPKKKGRSLLLGRKLDTAVQNYILKLREHGCPINAHLTVAAARGIVQAMDRTKLAEYGGSATLTTSWAKSLLKRMNFTKRRASTKCGHSADELEKEKEAFLSQVLDAVGLNDIPQELIFNWDQTGINLVPTALWTLDKKGKKQIKIAGYQDKRQITAVMCGSLVGELLPFQLVYAGKTSKCHPSYEFPMDWQIVHTHNHWSNEETMLMYIAEIIVPFVNRKREDLDLNNDHPALAIFDHFKGQLTDGVRKALQEHNIHSVLIPAGYTGELQPMDISVNKVVKSFLRSKFSQWYSDELTKLFMEDDDDPVELSTPRMKCVSGQWLVQLYEYLEDNPHIIVHGFRHAGIYDALGLLDENDLPDYATDESDFSDYATDEDEITESASSKLLVSDVYSDSQEEESEFEGTKIDDVVIITDSD